MRRLIVLSDWAQDVLYRQEFLTALEGAVKSPSDLITSYIPTRHSSIVSGYILEQLVRTEQRWGTPQEKLIFVDTEWFNDEHMINTNPELPPFYVIKLVTGMYICGTNTNYQFSGITSFIEKVFQYTVNLKTGIFTARDEYAHICAHLLDDLQDDMKLEEQHINTIPQREGHYIGYIDGRGVIKTTHTTSSLRANHTPGQMLKIQVGKIRMNGRFLMAPQKLDLIENILCPGGFGHSEDPYIDIILRQQIAGIKEGLKVIL